MEQAGQRLAELGKPFLVDAQIYSRQGEDLDWRGDKESAGGGVLLNEGYPLVDTVIHWLGPPAEVFAVTAQASLPRTRYTYDTEDTAVVVLKYAGGAIATFTCCWTSGPSWRELTLRTGEGTIRIDPARISIMDRDGKPLCTPFDRAPNVYSQPIRAFVDNLATPPNRMKSRARDHLWTMAVLEAAYLSARTGEAESPSKWFDILSAHEGTVIPGLDLPTHITTGAEAEVPAESDD
jgi:predicted dehydrogenase